MEDWKERLIKEQKELKERNVTCSPNNIIVISSNAYDHPVEGEYIAKVAGFNGDNQLMVHSNETMMFRDFSEDTAILIAGTR